MESLQGRLEQGKVTKTEEKKPGLRISTLVETNGLVSNVFLLNREVCVQKTRQNTNRDPASIILGMAPINVATTRFMTQLEMDSLCTVTWRLSLVQHGLLSYLGAMKIRFSRALGIVVVLSPSERLTPIRAKHLEKSFIRQFDHNV